MVNLVKLLFAEVTEKKSKIILDFKIPLQLQFLSVSTVSMRRAETDFSGYFSDILFSFMFFSFVKTFTLGLNFSTILSVL